MKFNTYFKKFTFFSILLLMATFSVFAQTQNLPEPREEKLLNGTKLLIWNDPKAEKVVVKIRIHSGSAFDPQGKEGAMQLLSDILFPNESTREFFTDDLGGNLEIITNYDYIQINASGNSDKFLTILETLATAVTNPQINKETTEKVRSALLTRVKELEKNPSYVADQAVAKRLFGNFPYGRPQLGNSETVAKIDFADLLLADQKFITADNATIAISGNVKADFALRAAKRLFGGWLKADKKVPATFAQPVVPNEEKQIINIQDSNEIAWREAVRGFARNDKDYVASNILAKIIESRWFSQMAKEMLGRSFVKQEARLLPSLIVVGNSFTNKIVETNSIDTKDTTQPTTIIDVNVIDAFTKKITNEDFDKAKSEIFQQMTQTNLLDWWLDVETYKLNSIKDDQKNINNVTLADVNQVAEKLQKLPTVLVEVKSLSK